MKKDISKIPTHLVKDPPQMSTRCSLFFKEIKYWWTSSTY